MTTTDSTNGFADPTVTDRIARILLETEPELQCAQCRPTLRPCRQHLAIAIVDAMRAQELVVLTKETADQIIEHTQATVRREVAEEIAAAIEAAAAGIERGAFDPTLVQPLVGVMRADAAVAREFAAKGADRG